MKKEASKGNNYISNSEMEIQKLKDEIKRLKTLVIKDELTGVLNRKGIEEEFDLLFKEVFYVRKYLEVKQKTKRKIHSDNLAILFFDADNFKKVNDTYGHSVGDKVLKVATKVIRKKIRGIDLLGRFGGEEFVVALVGTSEEEAFKKAEEIREYVNESVVIPGHEDLRLTFSIGVASLDKCDTESVAELIAMADRAMYEAKTNRGKNNTVKYSELKD